jgi:hypothetical protein
MKNFSLKIKKYERKIILKSQIIQDLNYNKPIFYPFIFYFLH